MFRRIQHVHFVGIGGIGMSGIAEVLINLGFRVSGSDMKRSSVTDRLQQLGVEFFEGHSADNVGQPHVVVRSTAVREDNPEIVQAHQRSIPVIPRAEMLAELMRLKPHTVAVAGSHGKTTTTSMVATVLGHAELDPTMVVGGVVGAFGSNAHLGTSDLMVVEADESDRSFLMLTPTIAVVTNIDREHMDYYHDMDDVRACFASFVNKVPFYGSSVLCLDDPNVQAIIPLLERRRLTFPRTASATTTILVRASTCGAGRTWSEKWCCVCRAYTTSTTRWRRLRSGLSWKCLSKKLLKDCTASPGRDGAFRRRVK